MSVQPLYRDFTTQAELDAQYDIEATVPDFMAYANDFVERSEAYRGEANGDLDVRFGATLDETYDVFLPSGDAAAPRPVLYFVHGGYWLITTSKVWSYVAKGLCARGYVVVVPNYSLCPQVTVPEIIRQHRSAFWHFYTNAGRYAADLHRIVVAGHSVGGHAVASLLDTEWEERYGLPAQPFLGALPISGLYDVRPIPHTMFNENLHLDEEIALALSVNLRIPESLPPMVVAHGAKETEEFARQSTDYEAALREAGHPVELLTLDNNHFDILESLADGTGALAQVVERLATRG